MQEQTNIVNDINNHFSELTYIPKSKTTRVNKQYYIDLKNDLGCRLQVLSFFMCLKSFSILTKYWIRKASWALNKFP